MKQFATNDKVRTTRIPRADGVVMGFGYQQNGYLVRLDKTGKTYWYSGHELEAR